MIINLKTDQGEAATRSEEQGAVRASISFPPDVYRTLETIARRKKVSLAWVVRDAAEKYLADEQPLFARPR